MIKDIDGIPVEVFKEYEQVRKSGLSNMLDYIVVRRIADELGLDSLVRAIDEGGYSRILELYHKAIELGVIERG